LIPICHSTNAVTCINDKITYCKSQLFESLHYNSLAGIGFHRVCAGEFVQARG
jgi:hypothetical protein